MCVYIYVRVRVRVCVCVCVGGCGWLEGVSGVVRWAETEGYTSMFIVHSILRVVGRWLWVAGRKEFVYCDGILCK